MTQTNKKPDYGYVGPILRVGRGARSYSFSARRPGVYAVGDVGPFQTLEEARKIKQELSDEFKEIGDKHSHDN